MRGMAVPHWATGAGLRELHAYCLPLAKHGGKLTHKQAYPRGCPFKVPFSKSARCRNILWDRVSNAAVPEQSSWPVIPCFCIGYHLLVPCMVSSKSFCSFQFIAHNIGCYWYAYTHSNNSSLSKHELCRWLIYWFVSFYKLTHCSGMTLNLLTISILILISDGCSLQELSSLKRDPVFLPTKVVGHWNGMSVLLCWYSVPLQWSPLSPLCHSCIYHNYVLLLLYVVITVLVVYTVAMDVEKYTRISKNMSWRHDIL